MHGQCSSWEGSEVSCDESERGRGWTYLRLGGQGSFFASDLQIKKRNTFIIKKRPIRDPFVVKLVHSDNTLLLC